VRMTTWNVENFFRPGGRRRRPDEAKAYEAKLEALATTITALAPDVLAVQEVGSPLALGRARRAPGRVVIHVGFISRLALTAVEQTTENMPGLAPVQDDDDGNSTKQLGRPMLSATVTRDGGPPVSLVSCLSPFATESVLVSRQQVLCWCRRLPAHSTRQWRHPRRWSRSSRDRTHSAPYEREPSRPAASSSANDVRWARLSSASTPAAAIRP
jgi:hypothetical protein